MFTEILYYSMVNYEDDTNRRNITKCIHKRIENLYCTSFFAKPGITGYFQGLRKFVGRYCKNVFTNTLQTSFGATKIKFYTSKFVKHKILGKMATV